MVRVFLIERIKSRVVSDKEHRASEPHSRVGHYLRHAIQSHRVMKEFREADFHHHASMAPSVVDYLSKHRVVKFDIGVLKVKIWEQDNILTKQAKYIKHVKSTLY